MGIRFLEKSDIKFEYPVEWGVNLQTEHERFLTEDHFKSPVTVHDYPRSIKPFYMRVNDDDNTSAAMDLLVPGIGEIIGGSQREERLEVLLKNMKEHNVSEKDLLKKYTSLLLLINPLVFGQVSGDNSISISALADLSVSSQDTAFQSHGLEIVMMGKITPNSMVMAYIANHKGGGAIAKEFYANFNTPLKFISSYKIGYFRPNFGIINRQHEHTYNFMKKSMKRFIKCNTYPINIV